MTISYNQAKFLEEAILSVIQQDYHDIEYIVVDPGSTDGSREIIEKYKNKISKIISEPDNGPADGLNKGFSSAGGEVFGFLNSDDELLPGALSCIAEYFISHPEIDVVSGCGFLVDENNGLLGRAVPSKITPWLYVNSGVSVFQQGTFFRSSVFRQVGGFNKLNKTCWDGELFLDMALVGAKFATIGERLALFRLHGEGITGSGRLEQAYLKDVERLFYKVNGRQKKPYDNLNKALARIAKFIYDPAYLYRKFYFDGIRKH